MSAQVLPSSVDLLVRPMRSADVAETEQLSADAFLVLERSLATPRDPEPQRRTPGRAQAWIERTSSICERDAAGCWVAERDGALVGVATSFRRETTWFLATYAVRPDQQGQGIGAALLKAAMGHARGCLRAMLSASADPRAARHYRLAGFDLHPQMSLSGTITLDQAPSIRHVRAGASGDQWWMDSLDRLARGAARGCDHDLLRAHHRLRVVEHNTGRGYVYTHPDGSVAALAASNRRTAARLLWHTFADCPTSQTTLSHVTAANQWAIEVGMAAGLSLRTDGYLGLRGLKPPTPYLHHGALL